MTNEEARSNLEKLLQLYDDGMIDFTIIRESIKVALEALKAQTNLQPTCNNLATDTISRQAAIDNLKRHLNETDVPDSYPGIFNAIEEWLDDWEVPSAQPERKKEKWFVFDSDDDKFDEIKCPCCKHIFTVDSYHWTDIGFVKDDLKFCPNCGADMRGETDG